VKVRRALRLGRRGLPERSREAWPDLVVAMNRVYLEEIGGALSELGVDARLEAV
jgi:hypothetical protein